MNAVHLEKSDLFKVSGDKHVITFLFKNYGGIDGLDFLTTCAPSIRFSFQSDGVESPHGQDRDRPERRAPADRPVRDLPQLDGTDPRLLDGPHRANRRHAVATHARRCDAGNRPANARPGRVVKGIAHNGRRDRFPKT